MEAFSGVHVLTYCVISNHSHILVEVLGKEREGEVPEEGACKRGRSFSRKFLGSSKWF